MLPLRSIGLLAGRLALSAVLLAQVAGCKGFGSLHPRDALVSNGHCAIRSATHAVPSIAAPADPPGRACDDAEIGPVVETIFSRDVVDGERLVDMESELGTIHVKVMQFNTRSAWERDRDEYEAAYHSDTFNVALVLPSGESVGAEGPTLVAALRNAESRCRKGTSR